MSDDAARTSCSWLRWLILPAIFATLPLLVLNFLSLVEAGDEGDTIVGRWDLVLLNVAFFCLFLFLLPYRRKIEWRSKGMAAAFFTALFAEMYGLPLSAYLLSPVLGGSGSTAAEAPGQGRLFGFTVLDQGFTVTWTMALGLAFTAAGMVIVALGWRAIHKAHAEPATNDGAAGLVTTGLYAHSRHPQYLGFGLLIYGWLLGWPTLLGLAMVPLLAYIYYRLAKEEEADARKEWPAAYAEYAARVPRFI